MRRIVVAVMGTLSGLVLLFSYHTSTNSTSSIAQTPTPAPSTTTPSTAAPATASGTFTGDVVSTRWGDVQVEITVTDGKITQAQAVQYPQGNSRDQEINAYALPVLAQEVTQAQSAQIDAVSGATVTSDGYIQSLQSALDAAHL